jgi:hypothetical protein
MFARIENNQPVEYPIPSIAARFPNTSFPSDPADADLPEGYVRVYAGPVPQPGPNENVVGIGPVFDGAKWVHGYDVVPLTAEETATREAQRAENARQQRAAAYQAEADPLYFKWQRGEATQAEWLAKIDEIKARYPDA